MPLNTLASMCRYVLSLKFLEEINGNVSPKHTSEIRRITQEMRDPSKQDPLKRYRPMGKSHTPSVMLVVLLHEFLIYVEIGHLIGKCLIINVTIRGSVTSLGDSATLNVR
jgi:hypothetical protein